MHSWQNGTRCLDGMKVLWCNSRLVWLVVEGSIHTWHFFYIQKIYCDLFLLYFILFWHCCLEMEREKRGG